MDSWPIGLQQRFNSDSFEVKYGVTSVRTDMDIGPAKVRSRFTDAVDVYSCSVMLDYAEYSTFITFYKTTLDNGVSSFLFDDPFTGNPEIFRFKDAPSIRAIGGRTFQVSMSLEKLP